MVLVLAISFTFEVKLISLALCHLTIFPVFPINVNVVELAPKQTKPPPVTVPPTELALTVTETAVLAALSHTFTIWAA